LTTHNKMLETQIAQQVSSSSTLPGRLPSKPEQNPRKQCNAIVPRSGKELESPKGTSEIEVKKEKQMEKGLISLSHESEIEKKEVEKEKEKETKSIPPKPYMPPLPFPQRFARA